MVPQRPEFRRMRAMIHCRYAVLVAVTALPACEFDTRPRAAVDASAELDAAQDVAQPDAPARPVHVLLSEVKTSNDALLREFIEIYNPTPASIDLRNYYLADTARYAHLPAIAIGEAPDVDSGDFIVRFPEGASIESGALVVVALRSSDARPFSAATYAISPTDATPPMDEAAPGTIVGTPELQNDNGEGIALFRWNGESDLVADVDLFNAGYNIAETDMLPNKSGVAIDGPDDGIETTTYADDAFTMPLMVRSNGQSESFVRVDVELGETSSSGNGALGHDETTEDVRQSWSFAFDSPGTTEID